MGKKGWMSVVWAATSPESGLFHPVERCSEVKDLSDAIRFPNVIVWFGLGGHELRLAAGEMGVVRPPRRYWSCSHPARW
jgi:hypothetical protein